MMMSAPGHRLVGVAKQMIDCNGTIQRMHSLRRFSGRATYLTPPTTQLATPLHGSKGKQTTTILASLSHRCIFTSSTREDSSCATTDQQTKSSNNFRTLLLTTNIGNSRHVAHLQLNRPETKNAFGFESARELAEALRMIDDDPTVRCLVLSGNGPNFTSGVDLKSFMTVYAQLQETQDIAHRAKLLRKTIESFQAPFKVMRAFSKPIIGVAHGLCYGLGMELSACSDIRYCSEDTKYSIREVLIGIAADVGSLQLMPKLVTNQSLLRELIYTGRDLTLDEVRELGFVSKILPSKQETLDAAIETAKTISQKSPLAIQGSKQNLRFSEDKPFSVGLDYNAVWNMAMMQGNDLEKAITAILSRTDEVDYEDF